MEKLLKPEQAGYQEKKSSLLEKLSSGYQKAKKGYKKTSRELKPITRDIRSYANRYADAGTAPKHRKVMKPKGQRFEIVIRPAGTQKKQKKRPTNIFGGDIILE